jgi:hypothetical protein
MLYSFIMPWAWHVYLVLIHVFKTLNSECTMLVREQSAINCLFGKV